LDSEIRTLEESIESIRRSIERSIEKQKQEAKLLAQQKKEDITDSQIDSSY
jgi:hypothetical protein